MSRRVTGCPESSGPALSNFESAVEGADWLTLFCKSWDKSCLAPRVDHREVIDARVDPHFHFWQASEAVG